MSPANNTENSRPVANKWVVDTDVWDGRSSPYLSWWMLNEGRSDLRKFFQVEVRSPVERFSLFQTGGGSGGGTSYQMLQVPGTAQQSAAPGPAVGLGAGTTLAGRMDTTFPLAGSLNPLKKFSINEVFESYVAAGKPTAPDFSGFSDADLPPDGAVVTAVIDSAIALGHQRFRNKDGSTRILAAWQQAARTRVPKDADVDFESRDIRLPYGQELLKPELDAALRRNTHDGRLDEDGFNRDTGLTDMWLRGANNEVEFQSAHGTHVMDLAAGADPLSPDVTDEDLRKSPIIAVTMPDHLTIGTSGNFLEYFVFDAILRVIETVDALEAERRRRSDGPVQDLPVVINLSYGLHAGPKDSSSTLENAISKIIAMRLNAGKPPLRIVLPAGNDNLSQGNAVWYLKRNSNKLWLDWRIPPEDQSSNYLEIWSADFEPEGEALPLAIRLIAPDGRESVFEEGLNGGVLDFAGCARVYCQLVKGNLSKVSGAGAGTPMNQWGISEPVTRQRYVVCLSPSLDHSGGMMTPAGLWRVEVAIPEDSPYRSIDAFAHIQTDQSSRPSNKVALLSYLDHSRYEPFEPSGAVRDTYLWSTDRELAAEDANLEPNDTTGPVQRKGTLNSLGALPNAVVVAGHRASDGKPAAYSSTGIGSERKGGRPAPTLSYPSDDGPAHPGLMAAGARSASTSILQGTSFATALATRNVAAALRNYAAATGTGKAGPWLKGPGSAHSEGLIAEQAETAKPYRYDHRVFEWKSGKGRRPAPDTGRMPRRHQS